MGEDKAGSIEDSSVWRCHDNPTDHCSWYLRYAELAAHLLSHIRSRRDILIVGLDPAPKGLTGCTLIRLVNNKIHKCKTSVATITDILNNIKNSIISIDAPFSVPYKGFRSVERAILQSYQGARLLPGNLAGMRQLTMLGLSLLHHFVEAGSIVFETHPGSIVRHLNIQLTHRNHIVDSTIASAAALCAFLGNSYYVIGIDGLIVLPNENCRDLILEIIERCL